MTVLVHVILTGFQAVEVVSSFQREEQKWIAEVQKLNQELYEKEEVSSSGLVLLLRNVQIIEELKAQINNFGHQLSSRAAGRKHAGCSLETEKRICSDQEADIQQMHFEIQVQQR